MTPRNRIQSLRIPVAVLALTAAAAWALTVPLAHGAGDPGRLQHQIAGAKQREGALAGAAAHLGRLERQVQREVAILQRRLSSTQADLDAHEAQLAGTRDRLVRERERLHRLRLRLREARGQLARLLRERYMTDRPDLVTVVLNAHGFKDLLDQMNFLHRVQDSDTTILDTVRSARVDAARETKVLARLEREQADATQAVRRERDALASMNSALQARRAALAQARAARLAALRNTRAGRQRAEKALAKILAERARANQMPGPGGPWAIPWPIVQCESGGQNLPPNSATASGYYQFLDSTWHGLGGSTPHAYQAPKAEQDRLASRLWDNGRGASNWDCAALVGAL